MTRDAEFMLQSSPNSHDDVLVESIQRHLQALRAQAGVPGASALIALNELALERGPGVTQAVLVQAGVPSPILGAFHPALINASSPGIGDPDAKVIFVGKALAFDATTALPAFILESTCLAALWRIRARGAVVGHLTGKPEWSDLEDVFAQEPQPSFYSKSRRK